MATEDTVVAGTGHRPPRLGLPYGPAGNRPLTAFVGVELARLPGVSGVVSGMAAGYDQALAHAAVLLGLPLVCALPFGGQDNAWPADARRRYHALLARAREVVVVSPGGWASRADNWKFAARDRWMVDRAGLVLALLDDQGGRSGTGVTVAYARERGVPVLNLWPAWLGARGGVPSPGGTAGGGHDRGTPGLRDTAGQEAAGLLRRLRAGALAVGPEAGTLPA